MTRDRIIEIVRAKMNLILSVECADAILAEMSGDQWNAAIDLAVEYCAAEVGKCLADIVPGDIDGARLACARSGALETAAIDIRTLRRPSEGQAAKATAQGARIELRRRAAEIINATG